MRKALDGILGVAAILAIIVGFAVVIVGPLYLANHAILGRP